MPPSVKRSRLCWAPTVMELIERPLPAAVTAAGMVLWVIPAIPNWLCELYPHVASVPSVHSARLCEAPAPIALTTLPDNDPDVLMATGDLLSTVVEFPS